VPDDTLFGNANIRSLADLSHAYEVVVSMRFVPITWLIATQLAVVVLVPVAPLALSIFTDTELASMLLGLPF
jgi:hypothetical protein